MIVQRQGRWVVLSMSGAVLGEYDTRDAAAEHLRQIEFAKAVQFAAELAAELAAAKAAQLATELNARIRDRSSKKR